jgi:hypothetical protein
MNLESVTLANLLPAGPMNLGEAFARVPAGNRPPLLVVSDALIEACEKELRKMLDIPLLEVMAGAWSSWLPVMEAMHKTSSSQDAVQLVEIGKHEVKVTEHPELELDWDKMISFKLRLDLKLTAIFKSVAISVRGGSIESVRPGSAELKASLLYGDKALLPEWSVGKLSLHREAPQKNIA